MAKPTLRSDGRWTIARRVEGKQIFGYSRISGDLAIQDLEEKVEAYIRSISEAEAVPSEAETFHEFAKRCWFPLIEGLATNSVKRYTGAYRKHIRPRIGNIAIRELKYETLQVMFNDMKKAKDSEGERTVQDPTIRFVRVVTGQIINLAVDLDLLVKSPIKRVKMPPKSAKRHRRLQVPKALELLKAVKGTPLGAPVFMATIFGMRRGEVLAAKWDYLNRQLGELEVHLQRQKKEGGGCIEVPVKHNSFRTLRLTRDLIRQLEEYGNLDHNYICTKDGKPWDPDTLTEYWDAARDKLGLSDWHFHDLRHAAAGLLHAAGRDLIEIGQILGHKSPDMSWLYVSGDEDTERESMSALSGIMGWESPKKE
jgi:integrase